MTRHSWIAGVSLLLAVACGNPTQVGPQKVDPESPQECQSLWVEATELVDFLREVTSPGPVVWVDYGLETGSYVIYAGEADPGRHCVGAWRGGEIKGYAVLSTEPSLPTRLYGYLLPWEGNGGPFDGLLTGYAQPEEVRRWLNGIGIESAVLIPSKIEGLPFEVPVLQHVQLSVHEGFHVEVQTPRWLASRGPWPGWDLQPDRPGVRTCYQGDDVEAKFAAERERLVGLVNTLLDEDREAACQAGQDFLSTRRERYELLETVEVDDYKEDPISCEEAEALLELEEGTADYASWSILFHRGHATREELIRRYNAQQADAFYLTGATQLHALRLMNPGGFQELAREIAESTSLEEGSITNIFRRELGAYCG